MEYEMLKVSTVKRIWNAFYSLSMCNNDRYISFRGKDNYWYTDRERFVGRFFKGYVGRYIAFMDKECIGMCIGDSLFFHEPESVFKTSRNDTLTVNGGKSIFRCRKRYLKINGFCAINEMYGSGFIEMRCEDAIGCNFNVRLDYNNMLRLQFKEIGVTEFNAVKTLFQDDREPMQFNVRRFVSVESKRGRKRETGFVEETTTVLARDADEARESMTNVLDVSRVE